MANDGFIMAIVFLPLLAALAVGLTVRFISPKLAQGITCGAMVISAIFSGVIFQEFVHVTTFAQSWQELFGPNGLVYKAQVAPWIISGDFTAGWTLRVDALTAVMLVVV